MWEHVCAGLERKDKEIYRIRKCVRWKKKNPIWWCVVCLPHPLLFNLNLPACCQSVPTNHVLWDAKQARGKREDKKKTSRKKRKQASIEKKKSNERRNRLRPGLWALFTMSVLAEVVLYSPAVIEILSKYTAWRCVCSAWHRLLGKKPLSNYLLLWRGNLASTPLPRSVLDCPFSYWS